MYQGEHRGLPLRHFDEIPPEACLCYTTAEQAEPREAGIAEDSSESDYDFFGQTQIGTGDI